MRDGRRKVGGTFCAILALNSRLAIGRMVVGVAIEFKMVCSMGNVQKLDPKSRGSGNNLETNCAARSPYTTSMPSSPGTA